MAKRARPARRREGKRRSSPQGSQVPASGAHGFGHVSVLLQEALESLAIKRGGTYADMTLGLGGHTAAIARLLGPEGTLIAFDRDAAAIEIASKRLDELRSEIGNDMPQLRIVNAPFSEARQHIAPHSLDGLLADFGVSSLQLDDPTRGFSFRADGPLDMRMGASEERTAEQVVNHMDEHTLADVLYELGEERRSRRIARAIVRARPIRSTAHLAEIVSAAAPANKRIHPATLTFQAIRLFVNRELDEIEALLNAAPDLLKAGGRLCIISFHSLEDRRVKDHMRAEAQKQVYELLTKKPITASEQEIASNPRSRSAKLRVAQRR